MIGMQYNNLQAAKGVLEVAHIASSISSSSPEVKCRKDGNFANNEPISVLDTRSPSPSTSTSTFSSSFGGTHSGGNGDNAANLAFVSDKNTSRETASASGLSKASAAGGGVDGPKDEWVAELQGIPAGLELGHGGPEKLNLGLEDWECLLSEPAAQDQSLLRWISGDGEDSSFSLKQLFQGGTENENEGNVGFSAVGQSSGLDVLATGIPGNGDNVLRSSNSPALAISGSEFSFSGNNGKLGPVFSNNYIPQNQNFSPSPNNVLCSPPGLSVACQQLQCAISEQKFSHSNPQVMINQLQVQSTPNLILLNSLLCGTQPEQPLAKRHNPGILSPISISQVPNAPLVDTAGELLLGRQQHFPQMQPLQLGLGQQVNLLPSHNPQQKPLLVPKQEAVEGNCNPVVARHQQQQQQVVYDQLHKATELILAGKFSHAQGILARLNHQLSPVVKPFQRAAFYFMEALELSLLMSSTATSPPLRIPTPLDSVVKIGAYKMLSDVSPLLQFRNFTSNQVLLEALDNEESIHIIDFDIGIGAQWSSFMQELLGRNKGTVSLKITAFASPSTHHSIEISLMHESLTQLAYDIGVNFELEVVNFDSFDPRVYSVSSFRSSENEVIAVNFPIWSISSQPSALPSLLCFIKQLSPKVMVSIDSGCERFEMPPSHHLLHALHYYETLLDSIDASTNFASEAAKKIERFLFQPWIERLVFGRLYLPNQMPPWANLFSSAGFSAMPISNFCEAQAECLMKSTQVRGFHVENYQASLALYWQRRELLFVSAWRC